MAEVASNYFEIRGAGVKYRKMGVVFFFSRPPKGEINANTTGGTRKRKGRLDTATTPPAEASGVSGAMPTVRKEEGVVLVRDRVRLVRSGRGVAG